MSEGRATAWARGVGAAMRGQLRVAVHLLRWVLLGAGALTAVFLVLAVVLVVNRRPTLRAEVPGPPSAVEQGTPLLPPPGGSGQDPKASVPDTPGDPGRAGEAVSRWERGHDTPRADTLVEILRACGFEADLVARPRDTGIDRAQIRNSLSMSAEKRLQSSVNVSRMHASTRRG